MDRAYRQVFASLKKARKELKAKDEQLMAQESELSALRAKVAELMTQQAARDGVNLASVDNSLYPSSTMEVESEPKAERKLDACGNPISDGAYKIQEYLATAFADYYHSEDAEESGAKKWARSHHAGASAGVPWPRLSARR